jgi:hypothetical protein
MTMTNEQRVHVRALMRSLHYFDQSTTDILEKEPLRTGTKLES